ncbi:PWWP domain-containing protein MUM1 [Nestor notabilis]|nr:PWWP domain-containing protein MUM1 [Nestor notabilis]
MTDQEYILCTWKKRLWPAKVLRKTGATKAVSLEVEILGLKEQISVSCAHAEPLKEEHIVNIASNLDQRNSLDEAVEELQYRRSLRIALDILNPNGSPKQITPSENGKSTLFFQENHPGSLSQTPLRSCRVLFKEKLDPQASKRKREEKKNPSLKTDTEKTNWKGSFVLEESAEAHGSETNLSRCDTEDLCNTLNSESQNCKVPESESLPRLKPIESRLLTKSRAGNKVSPKPKEEKSKQGRKQPSGAGSPVSYGSDSPKDQVQPFAEEGSAQSIPCTSGTVVPVRSAKTRSQLRRTLLDSSCKSALDDLEESISSESLAKHLDGRKKPASLKQVNGDRKTSTTASSYRKRKCRNCTESSSGPSDHGMLSDSIPLQCEEEEKSLSCLSPLVDEEEEDEELPSILSHQEPQSIEEGILVWCRLRRYPYWPAVVKTVKRKHKKACVLLIDGSTNDKKKGFSVSLRSLKHFDCEEKQDLIERAKEDYRQEIEWCIRLISDYRIRVGCHSFTGSFLEYFADDISYPVRKKSYQGSVQMTFPNAAGEDAEESSSETSLQKPSRKLLPDRTRAARDKANKKIVEFIVKTKGAEEHLLAILKSRKQSRWLKGFLNSRQYVTCVETYLEDEEQLDLVVNYLKEVYHEIEAKHLHHISGDGIKFISDVLLPEAIIYAISAVDDIDYKKAEEKYIKGPSVSKREREIFDEEIIERKKWKTKLALADGV